MPLTPGIRRFSRSFWVQLVCLNTARLFIGGALAAKDKQQMKTLGITHIVNMVGQNLYNVSRSSRTLLPYIVLVHKQTRMHNSGFWFALYTYNCG